MGAKRRKKSPEKGREMWKIKDLGISWDFLTQVTSWDAKYLAQPLPIFSHVSKENILFSLTFLFVPSCFFLICMYSC